MLSGVILRTLGTSSFQSRSPQVKSMTFGLHCGWRRKCSPRSPAARHLRSRRPSGATHGVISDGKSQKTAPRREVVL